MDLSFSTIMSGLLIGLLGTGLFMTGKRMQRPLWMIVGGAMCLYPYFIPSQLACWALTLILLVPVWKFRHA